MALKRVQVPKAMRGIMPVVVYPLLGSIVVGVLMYVVVGKPMAAATDGLTHWLNSLSGVSAVLLGALLGLMMAFDMGGPVNKAAYTFAVGGLTTGTTASLQIMAAVMGAGMVPPLALALASTVRRKLFTEAERENGRAAWLLGASFITEGAIPFAAADPFRVIPSMMLGSAVTGSLSMAFGATLRAPHGGIFVLPLIGRPLLFTLALLAGTAVSAAAVILLKQLRLRTSDTATTVTATPVNA
jgi:PTS system fructose-specific IIC component